MLGLGSLVLIPAVVVAGLLIPTASVAAAQECLAATGPIADPGEQGDLDNAAYIWSALRRDGFSEAAAAGVLGNLQQESGFDPTLQQDGGPGMGIAQWSRGGRWDGAGGLVPWAKSKGLDEWSLRTQVMFMLKEMHEGWGGFSIGEFRRSTDAVKATVYFHNTYERSADSAEFVRNGRGRMALGWLRRFAGTSVARGTVPTTGARVWIAGDERTGELRARIERRYRAASNTATVFAGATTPQRLLAALWQPPAQAADGWVIQLDPGPDFARTVAQVLAAAGPTRAVIWLTDDRAGQQVLADQADAHPNLVARGTSLPSYDPPAAVATPADVADPDCEVTGGGGQMICPASRTIQSPQQLRPNATQVARCVAAGWPAIDVIGGWRPSDPYPDHPSGQAVDIMLPQGCAQTRGKLAMGNQIVEYLTENAEAFRVTYLIWQQRIWKIDDPHWRGMSSRGGCTADHMDHVHVSTWEPPPGQNLGSVDHDFSRASSPLRPCPPRFACGVGIGTLTGTPGQIVDAVVTWAASQGTITGPGEKMSIPAVWRANDSHGSTVNGTRSNHQGPPQFAWAVDIFDPADPHGVTAKKDRMARALAAAYGFDNWTGSGLVTITRGPYRLQLIYRTYAGGNHFNHIHFGVQRTDRAPPPVPARLIYRDTYRAPPD